MDSVFGESTKVGGRATPSVADEAVMFRVLQDCSEQHVAFPERLLEALERHLGLRHSVCFYGSTGREALLAPAIAARGRAQAMCRPYLERYAEHDIFRTPLAERRLQRAGTVALWEFSDDEVTQCRLYFDEFLGRFGMPWVFGMRIEAAAHFPLFVSALTFDGPVPRADMARLSLLRRPLGSQLAASDCSPRYNVVPAFTAREQEIANLVKSGYSNDAIAQTLGIRVDTVKKHLTSMFLSCGVKSRTQLAITLHSLAAEP